MALDKTIGFIGAGNMARAIINGILKMGLVGPSSVTISDPLPAQMEKIAAESGVKTAGSNRDVVAASDVIVIATKPYHVAAVLDEVKDLLESDRHLLISICAGVPTSAIEGFAGKPVRVSRVMPNTPALIGCGSAAITGGANCRPEDLEIVRQIFDSVGTSVVLKEEKLDAVTGVTGSGPAYVFRFMEALLAAARSQGLTDEEAAGLVPQMVLGSVRMALESGRPLAELRDAVTTPNGTTAAGLAVLEEGEFMQLIEDCVAAATRRSRELASGKS